MNLPNKNNFTYIPLLITIALVIVLIDGIGGRVENNKQWQKQAFMMMSNSEHNRVELNGVEVEYQDYIKSEGDKCE